METRQTSKWATRWVLAAVIQGMLAVGLTAWLLFEAAFGSVSPSRIVAGGGAGTWFTMGYVGYLILGVAVTALAAFFFQYVEVRLRRPFGTWTGALQWASLILWNVGVVGALWIMMHAGYAGGGAALPVASGGLGFNGGQVHEIMVAHMEPIGYLMAVAIAGAGFGLLGYLVALVRPQPAPLRAGVAAAE